nr:GPCR kinase [Tanacetum cinerariifolium]
MLYSPNQGSLTSVSLIPIVSTRARVKVHSVSHSSNVSAKDDLRKAYEKYNDIPQDLLGTIPGTIHHKVIGEGDYGKYITIGAALILANVSVFSPKPSMQPSMHYLNITKSSVVKVFRKDTDAGALDRNINMSAYLNF